MPDRAFFLLSAMVGTLWFVNASPALAAEPQWQQCALESRTCDFDGTKAVRYGKTPTWTEGIYTDGVSCSNATFGDPLKGTRKECQTTAVDWTQCANENKTCSFGGSAVVRYGKGDVWVEQRATDGIACDNATFGDPLEGTRKVCEIAQVADNDSVAPTPPSSPVMDDLACTSGTLSWSASSDNVGVARYAVYRDGQLLERVDGDQLSAELTLEPGAYWGFYVNAIDFASNVSQPSDTLRLQIPQCVEDDTAPSVPGGLDASVNGTAVTLSWNAASDNIGVAAYDIFRDGAKVGSTPDRSYVDSGLEQNKEYSYAVAARDAQDNVSEQSGALAVTSGASCSTAVCSVEQVASDEDVPWGLVPLGDGSIVYSRRDAQNIILLKNGNKTDIGTVPNVDGTDGEGGLLGLAATPDFPDSDPWLYIYHTSSDDNRVVRMRYANGRLNTDSLDVLVQGIGRNKFHNGGRLRFGPDGKLYISTGDAQSDTSSQDTDNLAGKVLRINPDGSTPSDNPFNNPVWSYGHRNPQGLAFDSQGRLWEQEFGHTEQDETNLIKKGGNYGWPDCEGTVSQSGQGCATPGYIAPKKTYSNEDASCSGIAIVNDTLYVACEAGKRMYSGTITGDSLPNTMQQLFVGSYGRLRTVEPSIDGGLWLTTTNGGDKDNKPNNSSNEIFKVSLGNQSAGSGSGTDDIVSGATYRITNKQTGRSLEVPGGSSERGTSVGTYPYEGEPWHQWTVSSIGDGDAYRITSVESGLALNIAGRASDAGNAIQWPYQNGDANSKWRLESAGNGYRLLVSLANEQVLDEEVSSNNVTQYPRHGRDNQLWLFERVN